MPITVIATQPFRGPGGPVTPGQPITLHPASADALLARGQARLLTAKEQREHDARKPPRRRAPSGVRHQSGPGRAPKAEEVDPPKVEPTRDEITAATGDADLSKMNVDEVLAAVEGADIGTLRGVLAVEQAGKARVSLVSRLEKLIADAEAETPAN